MCVFVLRETELNTLVAGSCKSVLSQFRGIGRRGETGEAETNAGSPGQDPNSKKRVQKEGAVSKRGRGKKRRKGNNVGPLMCNRGVDLQGIF